MSYRSRPFPSLLLALCLSSAACSPPTHAARISALSLPEPAFVPSSFQTRRVLVRRFTEARPAEAGRELGGMGLVVPRGFRSQYTTGYREEVHGHETVYVGWLPFDLPFLLARSLPGDNVAVADTLPDAGATSSWDYVVQGELLTTEATSRTSMALIYLGLLGVPVRFDRYQLQYRISLYHRSDPDHPISTRRYEFDDRVDVGLYYNHKRAAELSRHALRTTLAAAARDLVADVDLHEQRLSGAPPPAAQLPAGGVQD